MVADGRLHGLGGQPCAMPVGIRQSPERFEDLSRRDPRSGLQGLSEEEFRGDTSTGNGGGTAVRGEATRHDGRAVDAQRDPHRVPARPGDLSAGVGFVQGSPVPGTHPVVDHEIAVTGMRLAKDLALEFLRKCIQIVDPVLRQSSAAWSLRSASGIADKGGSAALSVPAS